MKQPFFSKRFVFSPLQFSNSHYTDMRCGAPYHYLAYMMEGRSKIVCDRFTLFVNEGDVFYIPKNLRYQSYWEGRNIRFLSFGFAELATVESAYFDLQTVKCSEKTVKKIREIPTCGSRVSCDALGRFYSVMAEIVPLLSYAPENREQKMADEIKAKIRSNPYASLTKIAKLCGISEALLYERFKKVTQKTPNEYRQSVLCEMATELLVTTDIPVEEISERLNFSSSSYFRKILKKHTGKTPREIRRSTAF